LSLFFVILIDQMVWILVLQQYVRKWKAKDAPPIMRHV
jgi:hypothetical protein